MRRVALCVLLGLLVAAAGEARYPQQAGRLPWEASVGRAVIGARALVNITQDSLARLSGLRTARLSAIERGLPPLASTAESNRLVVVLDSLIVARLDTTLWARVRGYAISAGVRLR